jgi:hypothetical protein
MRDALINLGQECKVSTKADESEINHHINYLAYQKSNTIDTLMITHMSADKNHTLHYKLEFLKKALETSHGITFSPSMIDYLFKNGISKYKLDFALPAHDGMKRRPVVVSLLTNIYPDGRKREYLFETVFDKIQKEKFIFKIMGYGWDFLLSKYDLQKEYYPKFDLKKYHEILNSSDYVLYVGSEDCMAQCLLDACNAGVKTIAPKQPLNEDIGIDFEFNGIYDLIAIFNKITENRVSHLTWEYYAKKHLEIWEKLT